MPKNRRTDDRRKNDRRTYGASMTPKESGAINKPRKKKRSASNAGGATVGGGS